MATSYSARHLGEVSSTQDIARSKFEGVPVLITASAQTAGRGRSGAAWETTPRALAASLAFRPDWPPGSSPLIALMAGVAAADIIDSASLKWPNDVLIAGEKVAGLLSEMSDGVVVVGMGVNLWWPKSPPGVAGVYEEDPGAGEGPVLAEAWAESLLAMIGAGLANWPIDRYRRRCATLGQQVTWEPDGEGHAVDIDPSGALIVETPEGRQLLTSASVSHIRTHSES